MARPTYAISDPLSVPNNSYGIHIIGPEDLEDAARLVNSSGGDWGYVTLVIQKKERNPLIWQPVFDKMRRLHLIPIIRISSQEQNGGWETLSLDEIDGWVSFLNSLNWVIKNRYVIIGNEPNHSKEWGGYIDPEGYALYLKTLSQKLKSKSADFFILPAGLDASAPNSKDTMDEVLFVKRMLKYDPSTFEYIDGWTSHSYPQPNFSGSAWATGRKSIRTFDWELEFLRSMGIKKDLPIFITETGWIHSLNDQKDLERISRNYEYAFQGAWKDKRIVAVTPFVLSYPDKPFDIFSWKKGDGSFYEFYSEVQKLPKATGKPVQEISGNLLKIFIPYVMKTNQSFHGLILIKNTGQSIWSGKDIQILTNDNFLEISPLSFPEIEPGYTKSVFVSGKSPAESGTFELEISLSGSNKVISNTAKTKIIVIDIPDIRAIIQRWMKNLFKIGKIES